MYLKMLHRSDGIMSWCAGCPNAAPFGSSMEGLEKEADDDVTLRRSERLQEKRRLLTPIKNAARRKIEEEYLNNRRSGRSIRQLKMQRRLPNDLIREENRYNADTYDPLQESDDLSSDFVVSDDGEEDVSDSSDREDSGHQSDRNGHGDEAVAEDDDGRASDGAGEDLPGNGNAAVSDGGNIAQITKKRKKAAVITSDSEECSDSDDAPRTNGRRKKRASVVVDSDSDSSSPLVHVQFNRDRSPASNASSSSDDVVQENICFAPRKRRRSEKARDESNETPVRRSARVAASVESKSKARRKLFGTFLEDRRQFLARLADKSFVEQPEVVDEVVIAEDKPAGHQPQFVPISSLFDIPHGAVVNIRGKVVQYGQSDTRPVAAGGTVRVDIRQITLQDDSAGLVDITLWRQYSDAENVELGAFIQLIGLRMYLYKERPTLSTYFNTVIEPFTPPADFENNLLPLKQFHLNHTITHVDPWRTYVYHACDKCCYTKTVPDATGEKQVCRKCKTSYDTADTKVGVAMRVVVGEEPTQEFATMFTSSVRKLMPEMPMNWGDTVGSEEEVKDEIIRTIESSLPYHVLCAENSTGNLTVINVGRKGM